MDAKCIECSSWGLYQWLVAKPCLDLSAVALHRLLKVWFTKKQNPFWISNIGLYDELRVYTQKLKFLLHKQMYTEYGFWLLIGPWRRGAQF